MKRWFAVAVTLMLFLPVFFFSGCSQGSSPEKEDLVLRVNESAFTREEFNNLMEFEAYADPEMGLTEHNRKQFINYLIRKELLIEEAVGMKLDQKEDFVRTIEKYWESTLIRNLLDRKTKKLKEKILITDEEAKSRYEKNPDMYHEPFKEAKSRVRKDIESERVNGKLEQWIEELRKKADIWISEDLKKSVK